ncbi:MAG: hypothetical protein ABEN55_07945 [Bradymonadaceae bacterium]
MRPRLAVLLTLFALATAGCAGSSSQTESDDAKATASSSSDSSTETAEKSEKSEAAESDAQKADKQPVVEMDELIGAKVQDTMPEGCPGEWKKLKGREFEGELYSCSGFHAPDRYKEPTVIIGIEEGKIRRVNLQSFHEPGQGIEQIYSEVTNDFQSRCDRQGGAGPNMQLQCDGYLVGIKMRPKTGMLNIIYALKVWDMP